MDCNKEEAIRAKQIAEKRMQNSDFEGAQRIAQKAQRLFPALENISQLLTVCEVHCSAQNKKSGSEMDWYGILQIERLADDATVKKQYRKLALLLHPDKNNFVGAEAAFKLIGEAHRVLTDQAKRSVYDMKCRVSVKTAAPKPPSNQSKKNSFVRKQNAAATNFQNVPNSQFSQTTTSQQTQGPAFWTCCPYCGVRYQYFMAFLNKLLRCQSCQKPFNAYDLGTQGVPPGSTWRRFPNQKEFPSQGPSNVASQSNGGNPSAASFQVRFAGLDPVSKAGGTAGVGGSTKTEEKKDGHVDVGVGKEGVGLPKCDAAKPRESATSRNASRKMRKPVVKSSESCKTGTIDHSEKDAVIQENGGNPAEQYSGPSGSNHPRRSWQKQNVSYSENLSDKDDFVNPPKRSRASGSFTANEEETKEAAVDGGESKNDKSAGSAAAMDGLKKEVKRKASASLEETVLNKKGKPVECKVKVDVAAALDCNDEKFIFVDGPELNSNAGRSSEIFKCPDPDFSDFGKDVSDDCFAVDQLWAIYDTMEGMPRFYARVRKVFSPGFKLRITWLEPNPDDQGEIAWCDEELPVACGKFRHGHSEETEDRLMFSHQMHWMKGEGRCCYLIYPRKGETWALFRNWDIRWSSDPRKHIPYEYDFVEVLSDFDEDVGIGVAYLGKVKGFVSLFRQSEQYGTVMFQMPPGELYRFSHQIPSFRMTGKEREGVPKGSFELDTAALPTSFNEFGDPSDVKMENENVDNEIDGLCSKSPDNEVKAMLGSKRNHAPKKHGRSDPERESSVLRRSPRALNSACQNHNRAGSNQCIAEEDGSKHISHGNQTQPKGSATICEADQRINTPKKLEKNDYERDSLKLRRSPRDLSKKDSQVKASHSTTRRETDKHSDVNKDENYGSFMQSKESSLCQTDEKMNLHMDGSSNNSSKSSIVPPPMSSGCKISAAEWYDFNADKSKEKFQLEQIWALYRDGLPKTYAQVKKIVSTPDFELHVALLEACSPSKEMTKPVCCGIFKVNNSKIKVFSCTSFSHRLSAEPIGKNRYKIFPRKGEVWAIYKNWNSELTCSDLVKGEYDIVEVLEDNDQGTTVVVLVRANGFESVYRAPRSQRSKTGIIDIPRNQLARFSHQIPAFQNMGDKDTSLRGCWELDRSSLPGLVICLD